VCSLIYCQESKLTIIDQKPAPAYVLGVADGVGSWNQRGIDPSLFSNNLMKNCKRLVKEGNFVNDKPMELLDSAFYEMEEASKPIGSSTACISILNQSDGKLFTANLGDSGFRVFRKGEIVQRSLEQQHSFNYPYQLAIVPSDWKTDSKDMPQDSDNYAFTVEHGDIIALASDGILDNVYDSEMAEEIGNLQLGPDTPNIEKLQACADSITSKAKRNQQDRRYLSPFAKNAYAQGINFMGGKEDDTTLLLASVTLIPDGEKTQEKDEL
jgi:protein phosphatase PTC7